MYLASLFIAGGPLLRMFVRTGQPYDTYHAPFAWADLLAPFTGTFSFATYIPQYNSLLGFLIEPWFYIFGASDESLSALMIFLALIIFFCLVRLLRRFWTLQLATLFAAITFAFGLITEPIGGAGGYFQVFPLRYVLPMLALVVFDYLLPDLTPKQLLLFGFILATSSINNFEWGMTTSFTLFVAYIVILKFNVEDTTARLMSIFWVLLGGVATSIFWFLVVWIRSGYVPDPMTLLFFAQILGGSDNMIQAPVFGLLEVFLVTFFSLCAYSLYKLSHQAPRDQTGALTSLFATGMFGLAISIYPFGRSLPVVNYALFIWWALAIFMLLGAILIDFRVQKLSNSRIAHAFSTSLAGIVLLGAVVITYISSNQVSPILVANRILTAAQPSLEIRATTEEAISSGSAQEAMIFALHSGKQIAVGAERSDNLPFNSSVSMGMTRGQRTALAGAMSNSGTQQAVIWAPCCTPALITDLLQAANFHNYKFSAAGEDGSGPLVLRRSSPMGLLSALSPDGLLSVDVQANQQSLSLLSPEEFVSAFTLHISTSGSAAASRKIYHKNNGLFILNDIKISNSGVVVLAGAAYLLDQSSESYRWGAQVQVLDKFGNLKWFRQFSDLFSTINTIDISSSGEILIGGGSFGDPSDEVMSITHMTLKDSFLIHLDEKGKMVNSEYENLGGNDQTISVSWFSADSFMFVVTSEGPNPNLLWGVGSTKSFTSSLNQPLKKISNCSGIETLFEPIKLNRRSEVKVKTSCSIGSDVQYKSYIFRLK